MLAPTPAKRDYHLRKKLFTEESFFHKAKYNLYWLAQLIHKHIPAGVPILDPMGGSGSILLATLNGHPVITGDLEPHWVDIQKENYLRIRQNDLFVAPAEIYQWDATKTHLGPGSVASAVFSPPYFDMFSDWSRTEGIPLDGKTGATGLAYGFSDGQIGNLHVYPAYLEAMRRVYQELFRVLEPGGKLISIVGDRIKNRKRVYVTLDNHALAVAVGFTSLTQEVRHVTPSQYRRIHQRLDPDYPVISEETALVFQKPFDGLPGTAPKALPFPCTVSSLTPKGKNGAASYALVQAPSPQSAPGVQLFRKQLARACQEAQRVFVWTSDGLVEAIKDRWTDIPPNGFWFSTRAHPKAALRRPLAHEIARQLVTKYGLATGNEIALHLSKEYGAYLEEHLTAFGVHVTLPTENLNFGQKLTYYSK